MSKKVEQLILRIFDELTIELFIDWLKDEAVGEACCVSRREEMAEYSVVKIEELKNAS